MPIMDEILNNIAPGTRLRTPSGRASFEVERVGLDGVLLRVGRGWHIFVSRACWDGIAEFLRGRGWVLIGATHGSPPTGSLDDYLQRFTHGVSAASYVVPILERILLVQVSTSKPSEIRLIE